jgi:thiol-disulfide isomerase/thioredoxin
MSDKINCPKCNLDLKARLTSVEDDEQSVVLDMESVQWEKLVLRSGGLVVIEFWHQSCPSCQKFAPIFSKVAAEFNDKVSFFKLDVLKNKENTALAIKYEVTSTPTLLFLCKGEVLSLNEEMDGFESEKDFKNTINKMLNICLSKD